MLTWEGQLTMRTEHRLKTTYLMHTEPKHCLLLNVTRCAVVNSAPWCIVQDIYETAREVWNRTENVFRQDTEWRESLISKDMAKLNFVIF